MKTRREPFATFVALIPLGCYLLLVAAACYSWAVVGNWPSYGRPDPKDLPIRAVAQVASFATLVGIAAVILCPLAEMVFVGVRGLRRSNWRPHSRRIFVYYAIGAVLWIVGVIGWVTSHGGLVNWIFD